MGARYIYVINAVVGNENEYILFPGTRVSCMLVSNATIYQHIPVTSNIINKCKAGNTYKCYENYVMPCRQGSTVNRTSTNRSNIRM